MLVGSMNHSNDLAVAAIHLLFDAIAGKWSEYILRMHGFISALAEDIYDQPANDEPTSALWRVSKQLLQAERLLISHIQLVETIQIELRYFAGPRPLDSDWLHQDLEEFKRLSDEVETSVRLFKLGGSCMIYCMTYCMVYCMAYCMAHRELYGLRYGPDGAVWPTVWPKGSCMTPQGTCMTPRASCMTPGASCMTPQGSCMTPKKSCMTTRKSCMTE